MLDIAGDPRRPYEKKRWHVRLWDAKFISLSKLISVVPRKSGYLSQSFSASAVLGSPTITGRVVLCVISHSCGQVWGQASAGLDEHKDSGRGSPSGGVWIVVKLKQSVT